MLLAFIAIVNLKRNPRKRELDSTSDENLEDSTSDENLEDSTSIDHIDLTNNVGGQVIFSWSSVACKYMVKNVGRDVLIKSSSERTVLSNASGIMRVGEVTAIMGPSGSGKSTLLNILCSRKTEGTVTGEVSVLGQHFPDLSGVNASFVDSSDFQDISAYIPQREAFYPTQTAEEAFMFMANLRLGKYDSDEGIEGRYQLVRSMLDQVGLSREITCRPIGGVLAGGISIVSYF